MNSLDFVKSRMIDGYATMNVEDFEDLNEYSTMSIISGYLNEHNTIKAKVNMTLEDGEKVKDLIIVVKFDENETFDYFTMESCRCDGTMIFYNDLMAKCINKIFNIETYCKGKLPKNLSNKTLTYTIGNFVLGHEYGEQFSTKEKPWMCSRFTAMLPIKFEVAE